MIKASVTFVLLSIFVLSSCKQENSKRNENSDVVFAEKANISNSNTTKVVSKDVNVIMKSYSLSLDEILAFYGKEADVINDYLLDRGWIYYKNINYEEGESIEWGYEDNKLKKSMASIKVDFMESKARYLEYVAFDREAFAKIKKKMVSYGMAKVHTETNENSIVTNYRGKNYFITLASGRIDESNMLYKVKIINLTDIPELRYMNSLNDFVEE